MASNLTVDTIRNSSGDTVLMEDGTRKYFPGEIVQKKMVRFAARKQASAITAITELRLTITPRFANSLLYMQWTIFGESSVHNASFVVHKDGVLDSTPGYEGFNNDSSVDAGQQRVIAMFNPYEATGADYNSTPYQMTLNHMSSVTALGGIAEYYFEPAVNSNTVYINSSVHQTNDGAYENGVSFGYIEEIAQ